MKKVCLLIEDISMSGGTERVISVLSQHLNELPGLKIEIVSIKNRNKEPFYKINGNIYYLNQIKFSYLKVVQFIKNKKYDSVIVISMRRLSIFMTLAFKFLNFKQEIILSEHTSFSSLPVLIKILKLIVYNLCNKIIVLTTHDKKLISKNLFNISKIYSIINISPFSTQLINLSPSKKFIAIGRLNKEKGFDLLLESWFYFKKNKYNEFFLEIIGCGKEETFLKNMAFKLGIHNSVIFSGLKNDITESYSNAYGILMTSRYEGLPMVLIEGQSFGIPCISFDCLTGPRDIIHDKENGFLVENGNIIVFSEKISLLANDIDLRNKMAAKALENAKRFSFNTIASKWLEVIFGNVA